MQIIGIGNKLNKNKFNTNNNPSLSFKGSNSSKMNSLNSDTLTLNRKSNVSFNSKSLLENMFIRDKIVRKGRHKLGLLEAKTLVSITNCTAKNISSGGSVELLDKSKCKEEINAKKEVKLDGKSSAGKIQTDGSVELLNESSCDLVNAKKDVKLDGKSTADKIHSDGSVKLLNGSTCQDKINAKTVLLSKSKGEDIKASKVELLNNSECDDIKANNVKLEGLSCAGSIQSSGLVELLKRSNCEDIKAKEVKLTEKSFVIKNIETDKSVILFDNTTVGKNVIIKGLESPEVSITGNVNVGGKIKFLKNANGKVRLYGNKSMDYPDIDESKVTNGKIVYDVDDMKLDGKAKTDIHAKSATLTNSKAKNLFAAKNVTLQDYSYVESLIKAKNVKLDNSSKAKDIKAKESVILNNSRVLGKIEAKSAKLTNSKAEKINATKAANLDNNSHVVNSITAQKVKLDNNSKAKNINAKESVSLLNSSSVLGKVEAKTVKIDGKDTYAHKIVAKGDIAKVELNNNAQASEIKCEKDVYLRKGSKADQVFIGRSITLTDDTEVTEIIGEGEPTIKINDKATVCDIVLKNTSKVKVDLSPESIKGIIQFESTSSENRVFVPHNMPKSQIEKLKAKVQNGKIERLAE